MAANAIGVWMGSDTIEPDSYVIEPLMRNLVGHDRQPSAFLVYLYVAKTTGRMKDRSRAC